MSVTRAVTTLEPLPWESLAGLAERMRRANRYVERDWLTQVIGVAPDLRLNVLRQQRDYENLAALMALPIDTIYRMTAHRFVDRYTLPNERIMGSAGDINALLWDEPRLLLYVTGQQRRAVMPICPHCWREHGTLLLPWSLRHVTTCPLHQCLLVDRCACGQPLRLDLRGARCRGCGQGFGELPTIPIVDHQPSVIITALMAWATGITEPLPATAIGLPPDHPVHGMLPAALFRFITYTAQLIAARYPDDQVFDRGLLLPGTSWERPPVALYQADVAATHGAITAIWGVLADWPRSWYSLLERIAAREERAGVGEQHFAQALITERDLRGPAFGWLHRSWGEWVYEHAGRLPGVAGWYRYYQGIAREDGSLPQLVSQQEARARVGVGMNTYHAYLTGDVVDGRSWVEDGSGRSWRLLERGDIARLRDHHEALLNRKQLMRYLGVGKVGLREIVDAGLLPVVQHPANDKRHGWRFHRAVVDEALRSWLGHLPVYSGNRDGLTLRHALAVMRSAGVGLPEFLVAVRDGLVEACRVADTHTFADLRIVRGGAAGLDAYYKRHGPTTDQAEYTSKDLCEVLGCNQIGLRGWEEAGLLMPSRLIIDEDGEHRRYGGAVVAGFMQRYVTTEGAAVLLGIHRVSLTTWARAGRLDKAIVWGGGRHNAYLFDRAALQAMIAEQVSGAEAAAMLGVDLRLFNMWVAQGLLQPVANADSKRRVYLRRDVERVRSGLRRNPRTGKPCVMQVDRLTVLE